MAFIGHPYGLPRGLPNADLGRCMRDNSFELHTYYACREVKEKETLTRVGFGYRVGNLQ